MHTSVTRSPSCAGGAPEVVEHRARIVAAPVHVRHVHTREGVEEKLVLPYLIQVVN